MRRMFILGTHVKHYAHSELGAWDQIAECIYAALASSPHVTGKFVR